MRFARRHGGAKTRRKEGCAQRRGGRGGGAGAAALVAMLWEGVGALQWMSPQVCTGAGRRGELCVRM